MKTNNRKDLKKTKAFIKKLQSDHKNKKFRIKENYISYAENILSFRKDYERW
jgi:hypothetical protein